MIRTFILIILLVTRASAEHIVFIGDSLMWSVNGKSDFSRSVERGFKNDGVTVYAKGGWTVTPKPPPAFVISQANFEGAAALFAKVYVIALGRNDMSTKSDIMLFSSTYREKLDRLSITDTTIIAVTPLLAEQEEATDESYRQAIREVCAERINCIVVEGPELVPARFDLHDDNVHLNAKGRKLYARKLANVLKTTLGLN